MTALVTRGRVILAALTHAEVKPIPLIIILNLIRSVAKAQPATVGNPEGQKINSTALTPSDLASTTI